MQRRQHPPASLHALEVLRVDEQLVDDLLVERRLLLGELGIGDLFDLVGEVGEQPPVGLGAAQDERLGELTQPSCGLRVVVPFDRAGELFTEALLAAQQAGVARVENRPQLAQAVLDRRTREGDLLARRQLAHGLGGLGGRILHHLGLVEHHRVPLDRGERFDVAWQQAVGGDDDVGVGQTEQCRLGLVSAGAVMHHHGLTRREAMRLRLPVVHHAERADHQMRAGAFDEVRQRRRCLAQPHVVGQAAAQTHLGQELHPRQAAPLVVTELAVELGRLLRLHEVFVGQSVEQ